MDWKRMRACITIAGWWTELGLLARRHSRWQGFTGAGNRLRRQDASGCFAVRACKPRGSGSPAMAVVPGVLTTTTTTTVLVSDGAEAMVHANACEGPELFTSASSWLL